MLQSVLLLSTLIGTTIWAPTEEAVVSRADEVAVVAVENVVVRHHHGPLLVQEVRALVLWKSPGGGLRTGDVITIEVMGGESEGLVSVVPGSFRPSKGERALVYLSRHGNVYRPWGLSYGWLPIVSGADGKQWLKRSLAGLKIVGDSTRSSGVEEPWQRRPFNSQLEFISKLRQGRTR